jgi:hypothetical protein
MSVLRQRSLAWTGAAALMLVLGLSGPAEAQRAAAGPPDWPCIQRLIPELHWGTIWTGPSLDELEEAWWADEERGRVVRVATARTTPESDAVERVRTFAQGLESEKERQLTLLFAGLFDRISRERTRTIEAILRYSRGQVGRLERIGVLVDELEELRADDAANAERIAEVEHELLWERRVFMDRQASLRALCDQPYLLEERLSRLVRVIQSEMGRS